jgi:hypothetical protein
MGEVTYSQVRGNLDARIASEASCARRWIIRRAGLTILPDEARSLCDWRHLEEARRDLACLAGENGGVATKAVPVSRRATIRG